MTTTQHHPRRGPRYGGPSHGTSQGVAHGWGGPILGVLAALGLALAATGCPSPDASGKYDRFNEQTEDDREMPPLPDMGTPMPPMPMPGTGGDTETGGPEPLDIDGVYLVAVSTIVDPQKPLQFLADVDAELDLEGNGPVTVVFQPLSLDVGSTTEPREEVGDAIT
ncbi:MAG: hypothetical protein KDK70_24305, partial [Myxococcales bacterium]|nr:hypothetical protein [Myxococcales bacterium]